MRTLLKVPLCRASYKNSFAASSSSCYTCTKFSATARIVSSRISQSDRLFALRTSRRRSCVSFETIKPFRRGDSQIRFDGIRITLLDSAPTPTALFLGRLKGLFPSLRKYTTGLRCIYGFNSNDRVVRFNLTVLSNDIKVSNIKVSTFKFNLKLINIDNISSRII